MCCHFRAARCTLYHRMLLTKVSGNYQRKASGQNNPTLMSQRSGGSFKGDFGRAAAGAAGASLDTLVELEISKHVDSRLAKDVFAPNIVESTGMGIAASRLPDKRIALAVAAASWVYGRTENYFESKYHIEEKIGAAWKKYAFAR
jgi:hypothetical protein